MSISLDRVASLGALPAADGAASAGSPGEAEVSGQAWERSQRALVARVVAATDLFPSNAKSGGREILHVAFVCTAGPPHYGHMATIAALVNRVACTVAVELTIFLAGQQYYADKLRKSKLRTHDRLLTLEQRKTLLLQVKESAERDGLLDGGRIIETKILVEGQDTRHHTRWFLENRDEGCVFLCGADLAGSSRASRDTPAVAAVGREGFQAPAGFGGEVSGHETIEFPRELRQYAALSSTAIREGKASIGHPQLDSLYRQMVAAPAKRCAIM